MSRGFLLGLAWRSAWNRRFTLALTVCSIALSTFMLLGVERARTDLRSSFSSAVSGTDLIVGARTGSVQLLLYSVFHVGAATNNIRWSSVEALQRLRGVAWVVPLSLGDSHQGFPVLGTSDGYFEHFRYGEQQPLRFREGQRFRDLYDAVVGAEVADRLGYRIGQRITLAHGTGSASLGADHADKPFVVSGILARTGTPVDRTVHVSLQAMEAIHVDWVAGAPLPGRRIGAEETRRMQLQPQNVTAALVGLHNRAAVFSVQRQVNNFADEPLLSILPGVALDELWDVVGVGEQALLLMSGLVAVVSMAGLMSVVLAGLNERRRELAVLRAVGASLHHVLLLLTLEGLLLTLAGIAAGVVALAACVLALGPWLQSAFGLGLRLGEPTPLQWLSLAGLLLAGWLASLLPGWRAYRLSLADGLSPRI
ncbi:ABC transporter permease [Piscinibacter sp.]|uniref:ABC transporter permease n=1 Tax=Piscinibacter sp. TaxID=1903157 RepID=UPI0039E3F790